MQILWEIGANLNFGSDTASRDWRPERASLDSVLANCIVSKRLRSL